MFIDRPSLIVEENKKFQTQDMGRFDIYFEEKDFARLVDPEIAYVTDRFMGCTEKGAVSGWSPEDKVHIRLENPRRPSDESKIAEVNLDLGGDLYFTIWNSLSLKEYTPTEFEASAPFVTSDPGNRLAQVGIKSFCFHQLVDLSRRAADSA